MLQVENLHKTYAVGGGLFRKGRVDHAVNDVSFTVKRGETLGIVGESACASPHNRKMPAQGSWFASA